MKKKPGFATVLLSNRKRVLMVASTRIDCERRSDFLRRNGYEVDAASCSEMALMMSRIRSYDIVLLTLNHNSPAITALGDMIQKMNPNATVAYLADCGKVIPPMPCHPMLWMGEPLEYFLARVEALAATA